MSHVSTPLSLAVNLTMANLPTAMSVKTFSRLRLQSYLTFEMLALPWICCTYSHHTLNTRSRFKLLRSAAHWYSALVRTRHIHRQCAKSCLVIGRDFLPLYKCESCIIPCLVLYETISTQHSFPPLCGIRKHDWRVWTGSTADWIVSFETVSGITCFWCVCQSHLWLWL